MKRTLEISEETYEKIKDQLLDEEQMDVSELDDFIGEKLFFRTITYHLVGKVVRRIGSLFELKNASWVADSGRFMDCIKKGNLNEVEPVGQCWININTVTDIFPWNHDLPKEQK